MLERLLPILALCACGEAAKKAAPEVPDFCQPQGQLALLAQPEVYEHSSITVHAGAHVFSCDGGDRVSVDVEARVSGPDGRSIPAALKVTSQPYQDDDGGLALVFGGIPLLDGGALVTADLTFDTGEPGIYSLMLKFKPELGTLQGDVLAMVDRRGAGPHSISLPYPCNLFDLWADAMVCQADDLLVVLRNGIEELKRSNVDSFFVSDVGLWTIEGPPSSKTIILWSIDGTSVREAARATLPPSFSGWFPGTAPSMAARGDEVALLWNGELLAAQAEGGAITVGPELAVPTQMSSAFAMVLRPGEGALINAQTFGLMTDALCVVSFADGGVSCRNELFPIGADGDVLWSTNSAGEVFALELDAGLTLVQHKTPFHQGFPAFNSLNQDVQLFETAGSLSLGTPFAVFSPFGTSAVVRIPRLSDTPVVEGYGQWSQTQGLGASPRCFWAFDPFSQALRYIER